MLFREKQKVLWRFPTTVSQPIEAVIVKAYTVHDTYYIRERGTETTYIALGLELTPIEESSYDLPANSHRWLDAR